MVSNIRPDKVVKTACEVYETEKQLRKAQEECAELIVAIAHYLEGRTGGLEEVVEETADVIVVANEIRHLVGPRKVDDMFNHKIMRLYKRIKNKQAADKKKEQAEIEEVANVG